MNKEQLKHLSEEDIWNYIDNGEAFRQYRLHLDSCEECRALLNELNSINVNLKQLADFQPSSSFSQNVIGRWKTKQEAFRWFIPTVIISFLFIFGLSVYLLSQTTISLSSSFVQVMGFIIVLCAYLLIDLRHTRMAVHL